MRRWKCWAVRRFALQLSLTGLEKKRAHSMLVETGIEARSVPERPTNRPPCDRVRLHGSSS
jgi:hypothetical protein